MGNIRVRVTLAAGFVGNLTLQLWGQVASPPTAEPARNPFGGDPKAITQGAVLFRQECVFCHGVAARGGMRGPDLTTGSWSHGGSDADLARTISAGVPGTAMPANQLTPDEIWQILAYLRTLEQPVAATNGDQRRGEALFFGAARCSSCHIVNGRGGRLGPELSTVGSARSRAYIVEAIREPNRQLTQNRGFGESVSLKYDTVTAVTADGRTIVGVPMNEDTFTVQVMDMSERIHSLEKKSLKSIRHEDRSLMPSYDTGRLSNADLDDLVVYLQSLRSTSPALKKDGSQ
ncbi:MAG TPA: c-type cytochrome [Vicinamibacterales bacterium]|nr:c-type cytochrome [Vicinamibacterales bacterium]